MAQSVLDRCLCHRTRVTARAITRAYDEALRTAGLRATQLSVLAAAGAGGASSIKALADALGMDRTTLTRNLRPLQARGFVLIALEGRYRSRVLQLTPSGANALRNALPFWEEAQRSMRRQFGDRRWPAVQEAVRVLISGVQ